MTLSTLAILLGLGLGLPQVYALLNPAATRAAARRFPRSLPLGYVLMGIATLWFLWNVQRENISDFANWKRLMLLGFGAVGLGTCIVVRDFLAVRGTALLMMLLAKVMVDTARWAHSDWRVVIVTWAYVLVVAGMWFTISPWRLRDLIQWATETDRRLRFLSGARLAFALLVLGLGLTVFRAGPSGDAGAPAPAGTAAVTSRP